MTAQIERRLEALEARDKGNGWPVLLVVRYVMPEHPGDEPIGIQAAPPHFPAPVDRLPGESWDTFTGRLDARVAHLPGGSVVRVISRDA